MFRAWRHSLTLRLGLAFATLAVAVFAALGFYLGRAADAHMAELDAHELLGKLALVSHVAGRARTPEELALHLGDALVGEHGIILAINGEKGALFRWPEDVLDELPGGLSRLAGELPQRVNVAGHAYRTVAGSLETGWGATVRVLVARDIGHHTDFLEQLQQDFRLAILAAALLTVLVGGLIARFGMRSVRDIAQAAGRISAGQLAERLPESQVPPELAELVGAFNAMLGRLEESFRRLSDFSADLAHELRTPLHTLRMQTEVSLGKPRSADEYRELLASNLEEYDRLARIIGDMLFLAKAEHGLIAPGAAPIRLLALGQRLFEYYGLLADEIRLELSGDDVGVVGDQLMLERAIGNLLLNAIQHTPAGGLVRLELSVQEGLAQIAVANSGPAIPPEALDRIFERFVRLGQGHEGSGLGLAITRSIVLAHGGSISVRSDERGTEFVIRLPAAVAPA